MNFSTELSGSLFNGSFALEIQLDGVWLDAGAAASAGIELGFSELVSSSELQTVRLSARHGGSQRYRLGGLRLRSLPDGCPVCGGDALKLYLEGWSMPSPCGLRQYGECDFQFNPDYLKFVVSEPSEYDGVTPNHFRSEHLLGIQGAASGDAVLICFLTSADQYGRFQADLRQDGLALCVTAGFDDRQFAPGDEVVSEEIGFLRGGSMDDLLKRGASLWGERMHARIRSQVPVGWCSWYYYFQNVTEKDMLENLDFLDRHREFPLSYVQLDDGYQPALGDWLDHRDTFPHGVGYWAAEALKKGFKPALWLAPFVVEERSRLFREHPDWCIHDASGQVVFAGTWREQSREAVLDGTHPEVQDHFRKLFASLREMGFSYVKLDFMVFASAVRNGVLHDPKATRAQAFRRGLAAIREGFGDDGFILACTAPFGPTVGLVDAERVGTDITPFWLRPGCTFDEAPMVPNVCRNIIQHAYMHRRLFINDPDTHLAREDNNKLTENEVKLWTAALRICGGSLLLSDRFQTLTPERLEYSRLLLRDPDGYEAEPLDRMEHTIPQIWHGIHRQTGEEIFGLFNFSDDSVVLPSPSPLAAEGREVFSGAGVAFPVTLAAHSCLAVTVPGTGSGGAC